MPPKSDVKPMTLSELKRLVKKYNDLMGIDMKGISRDDLIKEIEKAGYTIDHKNKKLVREGTKADKKKRPKEVKMPPKDVKKDKAEKKSEDKKKKMTREEVINFILKNKDVLEDSRVMKLHKGVK
tara:strand:- start:56 stop:430 length:375 start_codon:yes stop_codon:yes gene_type:complete